MVFISHKSEDRALAVKLSKMLKRRGITTWMAPENIRDGYDYAEEIMNAIRTAEIINSFIYTKTINSSLLNLVYSVRKEDMIKNGVTIDSIMSYIGTVSTFFL